MKTCSIFLKQAKAFPENWDALIGKESFIAMQDEKKGEKVRKKSNQASWGNVISFYFISKKTFCESIPFNLLLCSRTPKEESAGVLELRKLYVCILDKSYSK